MNYAVLTLILTGLGSGYLFLPAYRLWLAAAMALSYFLWGIISHKGHLHASIVLEYLVLALLGMSLLIFLSLRA